MTTMEFSDTAVMLAAVWFLVLGGLGAIAFYFQCRRWWRRTQG